MQIVLYEPEIPPNTGNVARLCAATGVTLNLIEPLGFKLEDRYLKRAGLDYWPNVHLKVWPNWQTFLQGSGAGDTAGRLVFTSAKGSETSAMVHHFAFEPDDFLVFGPETRGLPQDILDFSPHRVRIPMLAGRVRSINLSTSAGIVLYAALARAGLMESWA
ncbi:MAG: tRNA (cytidine(34)-2'-O)-methyltransferase [Desulfovibrio sp.]|nr:tRNA (cytidine(34)-2'-O)-methyltransferase [Desulfovibrio sp.]